MSQCGGCLEYISFVVAKLDINIFRGVGPYITCTLKGALLAYLLFKPIQTILNSFCQESNNKPYDFW